MKRPLRGFCALSLLLMIVLPSILMSSCSKGNGDGGDGFPKDFNTLPDEKKMAYMMENASPDSVARFILYSVLGRNGAKISNMQVAVSYGYENYKDTASMVFGNELIRFPFMLPVADRMKILASAGEVDPQRLGYDLGLHYMEQIRERGMKAGEVKADVEALRKACANDPDTFRRFLVGFKLALKNDKDVDVPKDIYNTFINYE